MHNMETLKVVELFAGVGGFRIGLEDYPRSDNSMFETVWSNQWEPATKNQVASDIYINKWGGNGHSNVDINLVDTTEIPDHDVLVGGFPCQDYSVANTLKLSGGLKGKKGVLWWNIEKILREKGDESPDYLILENVDRLLKSPVDQRGRDFAIMLASLSDLGYAVEWRIINAADYGMPQRRRRVFFIGYHERTTLHEKLTTFNKREDWLGKNGVLAKAFPCEFNANQIHIDHIKGDLSEITNDFNYNEKRKPSPFLNSGVYINRNFYTVKSNPVYKGKRIKLGECIENEKDISKEFYVDKEIVFDSKKGWKYHKGGKKITRTTKDSNHTYVFAEGGMKLFDSPKKPSRTIITSEGGASPSRSKHLIKRKIVDRYIYRRLTPIELERLNMFPPDFTKYGVDENNEPFEVTPNQRAFLMGNALVVGVVEKIGRSLSDILSE